MDRSQSAELYQEVFEKQDCKHVQLEIGVPSHWGKSCFLNIGKILGGF